MLPESLMDEKQLDFNRPLLSIRRPSGTQTSEPENKTRSCDSVSKKMPPTPPVYKSDIKSGPVRNPGTVPFQWEHKPGKPKDDNKSDMQGLEQPYFVPKLPPGRTLNVKEQESVRMAKTKAAARTNNWKVLSSDKRVTKYESAISEDTKSSRSEYDDCYDEDGSEAYMDAVDTLSRSESFFLNCSVSGVSGSDGMDLQPSGIFLSDPQTRDFMMGRFLPAAKALASETPPHSTRKPPLPQQQPRQIEKVVPKMKKHTVQRNPSNFQHFLFQQQVRCEESEDENESDRHRNAVPGVCGLLPQICLKSSFGVLNAVPSMRMQAQGAVSVRRLRSNYPNSIPCHENENKHANGAQYEQRSKLRCQKTETQEDKMKSKPNGSVLQGLSQGEALSVSLNSERKEKVVNFHVSMNDSRNKTSKNFGELLASDDNRWEPCPESPVPEKTLYVDTVHTVKSPETDAKVQEKSESPSPDLQVKDVKGLCEADEKTVFLRKSPEKTNDIRVDWSPVQEFNQCRSRKENENQRDHAENEVPTKQCIQERPCNHDRAIIPLPGSVETSEEKIGLEVQLQNISAPPERYNGREHLVPPPLPKAPSDSWLKRTLPTMSSKNSSTWSSSPGADNFTKIQAFHISSAQPTWETMVKTSNTRQGLVHLSKEKLNPIPEA